MRTNLLKLLDLLIFCKYSLNFNCFRLKFSNFVTNQLNISRFLLLQRRKTLHSYYEIETKLQQFSIFVLIVLAIPLLKKITDASRFTTLDDLNHWAETPLNSKTNSLYWEEVELPKHNLLWVEDHPAGGNSQFDTPWRLVKERSKNRVRMKTELREFTGYCRSLTLFPLAFVTWYTTMVI